MGRTAPHTPAAASEPLVSVFLPTYQHEAYIAECLESCLTQTYRNIEIIVGDDASSDETATIAETYAKAHPDTIKLLRHTTNQGIPINANRILKACQGDFIVFSSGDDLLYPEKIERQLAFMQGTPHASISYHDVDCYDQDLGRITHTYADRFPCMDGDAADLIQHKSFFATNSAMVRREFLPPNGFDERFPYSSDWLFFTQIALAASARAQQTHSKPIQFIPVCLGLYRRHENNITRKTFQIAIEEQVRILEEMQRLAPSLAPLIQRAQAERLLTQSVKDVLALKPLEAVQHATQGLQKDIRGIADFMSNGARASRTYTKKARSRFRSTTGRKL